MTKKPRNALTELVAQFSFDDLAPESTEKPKRSSKQQPSPSPKTSKKQGQKAEDKLDLLEKIRQQPKAEITRITLDLDPETYEQLTELAEHTKMTKAKLLRALIQETAKLLQNKQ